MKRNTTAGMICKGVALAILVLGLLGALIVAMPSEEAQRYGAEFNMGLWLGTSAGIGLFSLMLYALGEIVDYLASIHECVAEVYDVLHKGKKEEKQADGE